MTMVRDKSTVDTIKKPNRYNDLTNNLSSQSTILSRRVVKLFIARDVSISPGGAAELRSTSKVVTPTIRLFVI